MKANIGISESNLQEVAKILSSLLADEYLLYTKTRNAHWNVEGPNFHSLHLFFESQYQKLDGVVDMVAERIRKLGHFAPATMQQFLDITHLSESLFGDNTGPGFLRGLLEDHDSIIYFIRENINRTAQEFGDTGTSDFLTALIEIHEELSWMIRAHFD